jgi:hypothetical protein
MHFYACVAALVRQIPPRKVDDSRYSLPSRSASSYSALSANAPKRCSHQGTGGSPALYCSRVSCAILASSAATRSSRDRVVIKPPSSDVVCSVPIVA